MERTPFDAACFPGGFEPEAQWEDLEAEPGVAVRYPVLDDRAWTELIENLRVSGEALKERPVRELVDSIGRAAERLLDPEDSLRGEALNWLVPTAGLSAEMADLVLTGMAKDWTSDRLTELLEREFRVPEVLDEFRVLDSGRKLHAVGSDLSFHVGAGTVPGVSVSSMIRSLLVKSAVLLKPGRGDVVLPVVFARALAQVDAGLGRAVAVVYWPGGRSPAEALALRESSVVVAYGGGESVAALRDRTPVTSRFLAYHHRVSVGLIGRDALSGANARQTASAAALAVSTFDQRGCVSPHVLYVEAGGSTTAKEWAGVLAEAMGELENAIPGGRLTPEEASLLHQSRGAAEMQEASGDEVAVHIGDRGSWTVIYQESSAFTLSCQNRVIYVKPVPDLDDVPQLLADVGPHLQTVALSGATDRRQYLATVLGRTGVTRVTSFEGAPWPPPWWHHDGASVFAGLVSWVDLEDE
jgi:hypothetical protein